MDGTFQLLDVGFEAFGQGRQALSSYEIGLQKALVPTFELAQDSAQPIQLGILYRSRSCDGIDPIKRTFTALALLLIEAHQARCVNHPLTLLQTVTTDPQLSRQAVILQRFSRQSCAK